MDEEVKSPREEGDDSASPSPSQSLPVRPFWCPSQLVFHPYSPLQDSNRTSRALQAGVRRPLVTRLTKGIVETYQTCNPEFKYAEELNPKRFLTSPSDGVLNDGHDNANSDLILYVNFVFVNSRRRLRYIVKDVLGHGTFGQVAKCWVPETNSFVALKIIKNQPAYYQQSLVEVSLLTALNTKFDPEDQHHIVRIYDHFVFQRHLCISFEMLDTNLYELIKLNNFRGLSMSIVQLFSKQILCGLALMKEAAIIHCDLKPENILLCASVKPAEVKIIDFGSACMEDRTVYSYIQSRYYRSPEVLLGYQYSTAIDMWSFGCIVAELFLGLPLFPGASEYDLLKRMIRILGGEPPDYVLKEAKNTNKFFKYAGGISNGSRSSYQTLTPEEYEARDKKKPVIGKEYFNYMNLEGIVAAYPYRKNLSEEDISKEKHLRLALIDFLKGLVEFDPQKRWSPIQASKHPFLTGEPFTCPYKPPQETQRLPVSHNFNVDHHPGGGHWFAAGLSPNVQGRNMTTQTSTHFQMVPYAQSSSYGSLGSYGSYGDHTGLGSSHGSYGDNFNAFAYYSPGGPSGMNIYAQGVAMVGSSPDARRRMIHRSQALGASPSTVGFAPLPLGASPSQHTPPSSYNYVSGSPGHYGSTSPARGCFQGSPLGRGVAASQFTRRRSSGYPTNIPLHEGPSSSNSQFQCNDAAGSLPAENSAHIPSGLPLHMSPNSNVPSMRHLGGGAGVSAEYSSPVTGSFSHGSVPQFSPKKGTAHDKHEPGFPLLDPGNWDPHYSDDLLLQEGGFDDSAIASQFQGSLNITQAPVSVETSTGIGRFNHGFSGSLTNLVPRPNGPLQAFPQATGPPPPAYGHSMSAAFMPHFNPNSPIRFGQHPIQQFSHGGSSAPNTGEGFQNKLQRNTFSFNTGAPVSSIGSSSSNATSWGRRTNYSVSNVQPSSHGRNDYSRIS